jgi:MFS family permease
MQKFLVVLVLMFGWSAALYQRTFVSPILTQLREEFAISTSQMGWIFSSFSIGLIVGLIAMGLLAWLAGTRWSLTIAFAGVTIATIATGLSGSLWMLIASRFLAGFFAGALVPTMVQTLREWIPSAARPFCIGLVLASGVIGAASGAPVAMALQQHMPWRALILSSSVSTLIAGAACFFVCALPQPRPKWVTEASAVIGSAGLLFVGVLLIAPLYSLLTLNLSVIANRAGVSYSQMGWFSGALYIGGAIGAVVAGALAWGLRAMGWSFSKARALALTLSCLGLPFIGVAAGDRIPPAMYIAVAVLVGAGAQGCYTILYSAVSDTVSENQVALLAGIGTLPQHVIPMVMPLVFNLFNNRTGFALQFLIAAALAVLALIATSLIAWLIPQEPARTI